MKAALCVVVLLGALGICCFQYAAAAPAATITLECCETFKTTPIPHWRLKSYKEAPWCPTPAVIFTNRKNMKICTKASDEWVKAAVRFLDRKHQGGKDWVKAPHYNSRSGAERESGFQSGRLPGDDFLRVMYTQQDRQQTREDNRLIHQHGREGPNPRLTANRQPEDKDGPMQAGGAITIKSVTH